MPYEWTIALATGASVTTGAVPEPATEPSPVLPLPGADPRFVEGGAESKVNPMGLMRQSTGNVYMITGLVLLVAASVDAISRRRASAMPAAERSMAAISGRIGLPVTTLPATGKLFDVASETLGVPLAPALVTLGKSIGPPCCDRTGDDHAR